MSTPQDPPNRARQKRRRAKQLAEWRTKNAKSGGAEKKAAPAPKAKG